MLFDQNQRPVSSRFDRHQTWGTILSLSLPGLHLGHRPGLQRRTCNRSARRRAARRAPPGARFSSSTMGRPTSTGGRRRRPGARASSATRTTRATAPPSRPASGRPTGTFVLIIDADGQHQPADAARLVSHLDRVRPRGRRARAVNAGHLVATRRQRPAERDCGLSDGPAHPRPHVRLPGGAARVPPGVHPPAPQRLLDADDDDAGVPEGGVQRALRADRRAASGRARRRSGSARTACASS